MPAPTDGASAGTRCAYAEAATGKTWPWTYCRTCARGPNHGRGKSFEPYFAPGAKRRPGEWDCADHQCPRKDTRS